MTTQQTVEHAKPKSTLYLNVPQVHLTRADGDYYVIGEVEDERGKTVGTWTFGGRTEDGKQKCWGYLLQKRGSCNPIHATSRAELKAAMERELNGRAVQ